MTDIRIAYSSRTGTTETVARPGIPAGRRARRDRDAAIVCRAHRLREGDVARGPGGPRLRSAGGWTRPDTGRSSCAFRSGPAIWPDRREPVCDKQPGDAPLRGGGVRKRRRAGARLPRDGADRRSAPHPDAVADAPSGQGRRLRADAGPLRRGGPDRPVRGRVRSRAVPPCAATSASRWDPSRSRCSSSASNMAPSHRSPGMRPVGPDQSSPLRRSPAAPAPTGGTHRNRKRSISPAQASGQSFQNARHDASQAASTTGRSDRGHAGGGTRGRPVTTVSLPRVPRPCRRHGRP